MNKRNVVLPRAATGECATCGSDIGTGPSGHRERHARRTYPGGLVGMEAEDESEAAAMGNIDREVTLTGSVGAGGANNPRDVSAVQGLLSSFVLSGQLSPEHLVNPDGRIGPATIAGISEFQERIVGLSRPDGRVDPGGRTLSELNRVGPTGVPYFVGVQEPVWPVETNHPSRLVVTRQDLAARNRTRGFGAARPNGRRHQGVDLYGYHNDVVRAIVGGTVVDEPRHFYLGTDRVLIEGEGGVILYGELERGSAQTLGIRKGKRVNPGDPIGRIGCMRRAGGRCTSHMLHLETYRSGITHRPQTLWRVGRKPPVELRDPTDLLRRAAARAQRSVGASREVGSASRGASFTPGLEALLIAKREHDRRVVESEFPSIIQRSLSASVGRGGINRPDDVHAVQLLLNTFIVAGRLPRIQPLTMDGVSGPKTIAAIEAFQRIFVGMSSPDGRVDSGGRTLEKLNGSIFQPTTTSAPPQPATPKPRAEPTGSVCARGRGKPDKQRINRLGLVVERTATMRGFATFAVAAAHTESAWNSFASNCSTSEASAACRLFRGAKTRGFFRDNPFPDERWCFGSGGWFGLLPATGLAAGGTNGPFSRSDPYLVFDPVASVVMLTDLVVRLVRRYGARNWLAVRRGMASPSLVKDVAEMKQRSRDVRTRLTRALGTVPADSAFMYQIVDVQAYPGASRLLEVLQQSEL